MKNSKPTKATLKRNATLYIKKNGFKIIKALNEKRQWTEVELFNKFKDKKVESNSFFIKKLLRMGLLAETEHGFSFPQEGNHNFLRQLNKKKISEKWYPNSVSRSRGKILSLLGYSCFIRGIFVPFVTLCKAYEKSIKFWDEINFIDGKKRYCVKIESYIRFIERFKWMIIGSSYGSKEKEILNQLKV